LPSSPQRRRGVGPLRLRSEARGEEFVPLRGISRRDDKQDMRCFGQRCLLIPLLVSGTSPPVEEKRE